MTLQTSVHLNRVHITLAGNTNTGVTAGSSGSIGGGGSRADSRSVNGEFRSYANGIVRLLTGTARTHTHSLALRALTQSQVQALNGLIGKTCLFRDSYGNRFYGSFLATDMAIIPLSGANTASTILADVGLTVTEVTYTEGV